MTPQKVILKLPVTFGFFVRIQLNGFLYVLWPKITLLILIAYNIFVVFLAHRVTKFAIIFTVLFLAYIIFIAPLIRIIRFNKHGITTLEYEFNPKKFIGKSKQDKVEFKKESIKEIRILSNILLIKFNMGRTLILPIPEKDRKRIKNELRQLGWLNK